MMYVKEASELKIKPMPPLFISSYDKKFNGKSWETDLSLNIYDFHARGYMPDIVRTFQQDPLAEKFSNMSPYSFLNNNPLYFIDPDGRAAFSPIYGTNGQFLGTDSQGFKGEVIFMQETVFMLAGGQGMDHKTALKLGSTLGEVIGDNPSKTFSQGEINMVNNAITDVVSKTSGYESYFSSGLGTPFSSSLYNGKTSSSYYEQGNSNTSPQIPSVWNQANDGVNLGGAFPAVAKQDDVKGGDAKITFNLQEFRGFGFTVENIQNTWVHEFGNHFLNGVPGGSGEPHAKALFNQSLHSSWKGTTEAYKDNIRNVYKDYTTRDLNR
jgi:RHS repeat-associated protein